MMGEVAASVAYNDGFVFANSAYARLICIKPEPGASYIWEDDEFLSEIPSPVACEGLLFVPTNYGDLVCYDAKSGEKYWEKWFEEEIYSSPMIAEGKLYLIDKVGNMHILKADKSGTTISEPELGEDVYATPAFANGYIYLRGSEYLYCIGSGNNLAP
jgi:outer membrane protein assembly factor BamB